MTTEKTSTALARTDHDTAVERAGTMSNEQLELLKRTIARGTTNDEFALFVQTSNRLGLDPFARQIFAVKRWDSREQKEVMSIQVSIDGFRACAARTGLLDGQDGPYWCGADGVWKDAWLDFKSPPMAAKVLVYRKGSSHPYTGIATYRSYVQTKKDGTPNATWSRGADFMLAKCAEALALRKAFPSELAGVYSTDEMGQAENDNVGTVDAEIVEETKAAPAAAARTETAASPPPSGPSLVTRILAAPSLEALAALGDEVRKLKGSERAEAIEAGKRRQAELQELAAAPPPDVPAVTPPTTAIPTGPELDIITADIITRVEATKVVSDVAVLMKEIGARLPVGSPQRKRAREAADAQVEKLTPAKTAKR
jgi:phage recombination protein Bet